MSPGEGGRWASLLSGAAKLSENPGLVPALSPGPAAPRMPSVAVELLSRPRPGKMLGTGASLGRGGAVSRGSADCGPVQGPHGWSVAYRACRFSELTCFFHFIFEKIFKSHLYVENF